MKKIFFLCILSCTLLGAGGSNLDKADGRWECDVAATLGVNKKAQDMYRQSPKVVEEQLGQCFIHFDVAQKKVFMRSGTGEGQRDFSIVADNGSAFVLQADGQQQKFHFTSEGKLVMFGSGPERDMVFRRAP